jgi:hypothetical protein
MADSYYGIYGGIVETNDDGEGVLQVQVPALFPGGEAVPARPALPYGVLFLPEVGSKVWVQFEGGEPTLPVWTGVQQLGAEWTPDPAPPTARVLRSLTDQRVALDDSPGSEGIALLFGGRSHTVRLTDSGVTVEHEAGHSVVVDDSTVTVDYGQGGPTIVLEQTKVTISMGPSSVTLDPASVTVQAPIVKLGIAAGAVLRAGLDTGIGNLGAPVPLLPGNPMVKA